MSLQELQLVSYKRQHAISAGLSMALHWVPPPPGALKINVHGITVAMPLPNGNESGIGAVYRDAVGSLKHITLGVIPGLSVLGNQMWALYAPLKRAFLEGYRNIRIETDNYEAYKVVRNFNIGAPASVYDIAKQIDILIHDKRWLCKVAYIFPVRNRAARFAAKLGMEAADRLYTLDRPVGGIEELLEWDMGLGLNHPDFLDVHLPNAAPEPVNFDVGLGLLDQIQDMGLGQENAPQVLSIELDLNDAVGEEEELVADNVSIDSSLFAGDPPLDLEDID